MPGIGEWRTDAYVLEYDRWNVARTANNLRRSFYIQTSSSTATGDRALDKQSSLVSRLAKRNECTYLLKSILIISELLPTWAYTITHAKHAHTVSGLQHSLVF